MKKLLSVSVVFKYICIFLNLLGEIPTRIMTEPGKGGVDFQILFDYMNEICYDGWAVVEQDLYPVVSFDESLKIASRTREFLKSVGV